MHAHVWQTTDVDGLCPPPPTSHLRPHIEYALGNDLLTWLEDIVSQVHGLFSPFMEKYLYSSLKKYCSKTKILILKIIKTNKQTTPGGLGGIFTVLWHLEVLFNEVSHLFGCRWRRLYDWSWSHNSHYACSLLLPQVKKPSVSHMYLSWCVCMCVCVYYHVYMLVFTHIVPVWVEGQMQLTDSACYYWNRVGDGRVLRRREVCVCVFVCVFPASCCVENRLFDLTGWLDDGQVKLQAAHDTWDQTECE